jgi:hypothetical protein
MNEFQLHYSKKKNTEMLKSIAFLFALISLSYQQPPPPPIYQRCFETPEAWQGNFFMVDYAQGKSDRGYIFYNRTEMRVHFSYDSRAGTPDYVRKWLFFNERKSYTLDEDKQTCIEEDIPFDEQFPRFGAPEGASFHHMDRLGSFVYNLGVDTDYFRMDTDDGGVFHGYYAPLFTSGSLYSRECVPVIESYENIDTAPTHQRNTHFTLVSPFYDN